MGNLVPRHHNQQPLCESRLYGRRLLPRLFDIHAAMMAPAAVISEGNNFSINSVLMQSRAVSNGALLRPRFQSAEPQ
jgi:hypothetical protein